MFPYHLYRVLGTGSAGGAIASPIFLEKKIKVAFSTPNISRLQKLLATIVISTFDILCLPTGLLKNIMKVHRKILGKNQETEKKMREINFSFKVAKD